VRKRRLSTAKTTTINTELKYLRAILAFGVKKKLLKADPLPDMEKPQIKDSKPPEFFTKGELKQLYAASQFEPWHAPVWKLLANTGMRRMEAMHAQWAHIREAHIRILSTEEERTKSGKWRSVPLSPGAKEALSELKKITGGTRWVLPRVAPESLSRAAIKCIKRAKLSGSLHTFRHTFISHLVMQGQDLRTVQKLAGHSRLEVTERYAHLAPDHLEKATSKLRL
jgi:integrase